MLKNILQLIYLIIVRERRGKILSLHFNQKSPLNDKQKNHVQKKI